MKYKVILIIFILLISGCYNYRELNDLAIISAIGIKKIDNNIELSIQVLDTTNKDEEKYIIFNTKGKTVQDALRNIMNESSKRLFINHMQVLLIDEELAKEGINDIIDFFYRDPESRKQFYVLLSSNIDEILNKTNGKYIKETIDKNSIYLNDINKLSFMSLLIDYLNPNKELVITSINIDNTIIFNKSGIFNNDKLIKYIDNKDMIYYNFILNKIDDTLLTYNINNEYISIEVIHNNTSIKKNKITFNIEATINDINNININNTNQLQELEYLLESSFTNDIISSINKVNTNIYGIKDIDKYIINTNIKLSHKGNGDDIINEKN